MPAGSWPTVGRDEQLRAIVDRVAGARAGAGAMVLIEGVAGSGKTHLLDELAVRVGADVPWLRARVPMTELSVPFAAPLAALRTSLGELGGDTGGPRSMIEAGAGEIGQAVVVDGLLRLVEDRCAAEPVVVVVLDDLHAADSGTVAWLDQLRHRLDSLRVVVVLAARPPAPGSPFDHLRPSLQREHCVLTLDALTERDVADMIAGVHGVPPGPRLCDALASAEGLPLFVTAILETMDEADLVLDGDRIDLDPAVHPLRPTDAPDAVAERVHAVPHDLRQVLLAAAVLDDVVVGQVTSMLGQPLADVLAALDTADRAGLLVADGSTYRFRHEFYRQAVLATATPPVLAALHGAAAAACAATADPSVVVAGHLVASGAAGPEMVDWLVHAAETVVAFEPANALTMADAALRAVDVPSRRLSTVRGRALASVGRVAEAEALLRQMLGSSGSPGEELGLRRELALALFQQGRPHEAMLEMSQAVALAPDETARARLRAEESFTHLLTGQFSAAGEIAEAEMAAGAALGDLTTEVAAAMVLCLVRLYHGEFTSALALADRLEYLTGLEATSDSAVYQPWFAAGMARVEADDHDGARRVAAVGQARCIDAGYHWMVPGYDALAAYCSLRAGELGDAAAEATAALDWRISDRLGVAVWCHAFLARVSVHRGDLEAADAALAAADVLVDQGRAQLGWDHVGLARAALAERRGDPEAAYAELAGVWDLHLALGVRSAVQECGPELMRLGVLLGDHERARDVLDVLDRAADTIGDPVRCGDRERAHAWWHRDTDRLERAVEHYRRSPRRLVAASAMVELATWWSEAGDRRAASTVARTAQEQLEQCGALGDARRLEPLLGTRTRRRHLAPVGPDTLSRTEARVVRLVSEGLTNTDIATRLHVSRRTVESHVSAAYRKLGVTNRVELARIGMDAISSKPA